jgi:hypothetical protein
MLHGASDLAGFLHNDLSSRTHAHRQTDGWTDRQTHKHTHMLQLLLNVVTTRTDELILRKMLAMF